MQSRKVTLQKYGKKDVFASIYTYQKKHTCYFYHCFKWQICGSIRIQHYSLLNTEPGLLGANLFTRVEYFCPSTNFTLDVTTPAKYAATALAHHVGFGHVSPTATQQVTAVDPDRCRVTLPAIRTRKIYGCVFFTVRRRRVEINKITPPGFLVVGINWSKLERFVSFLFSPCIGPIPWKQKNSVCQIK